MPPMTKLAFQTHGDPANPAVLMLHGFMSSNAQWWPNLAAMTANRFLVTTELWGHGDSPLPEAEQFSTQAYTAQFEQIRETLGIERWHTVGQSYGAGVIIRYALACPTRVLSVVATNSRSAFGQLVAGEEKSRSLPADADLRKLPYHPIHARRFPDEVKEALVASADRMSTVAVDRGGLLGRNLNCIDVLGDLEMPLLITNGRYEKSFQPELDNLKQRYPQLKVADLEGGHSVNIEAAADFNSAVLKFQDRAG